MNTAILLAAALAACQEPKFFPDDIEKAVPKARPPGDVEARKQARDLVLSKVGDDALPFCKRFAETDLGVSVLSKCKVETSRALVRLHQSGGLDRLRDPANVLQAVRVHGDPAGAWLVVNSDRLADPECLRLWCRAPLDYCFDLRDLEGDAAQVKASVSYIPRAAYTTASEWGWSTVVIVVLVALLLAVAVWKRKPAQQNVP